MTDPLNKTASQIGREYAQDVLDGKYLSTEKMRISYRKYLDLFDDPEVVHRPERVDANARNIERLHCPEGSGRIKLFRWQCVIVDLIWGFYWKSDGTRMLKQLFMLMPRKSGKTSLCCAIVLHELCKPVGGITKPDIMLYAPNEETCDVTMRKLDSILGMDELVGGMFTRQFGIKAKKREIECLSTKGHIGRASLESKSLEGQTLHCAVVDELSSSTNEGGLMAARTSFAASENGLLILTTTSGTEPFSLYNGARAEGISWLEGKDKRKSYFALICEAEPGDAIDDPKVWEKVHPSYGVTVKKAFFEDWLERAINSEEQKLEFMARMLCVPNEGGYGGWISEGDLEDSLEPPVATIEEMVGRYKKCWMGLDLSDMHDMSGIAVLFELHDGTLCVFWEGFYPRGKLAPEGARERAGLKDIKQWAEQGFVSLHPGDMIDHDLVADRIAELSELLSPVTIMTDTYHAIYDVQNSLKRHGITNARFTGVRKNADNYSVPIKEIFKLIKSKRMALQRNPTAWAHIKNCKVKKSFNGGLIIDKEVSHSDYKIDLADALVICVVAYLRQGEDRYHGTTSAPLASEEWSDEKIEESIW